MAAKKIHTYIGDHGRALCGANSVRSPSTKIVSNSDFVALPHSERCGVCALRYKARGYAIDIPKKKRPQRKAAPRPAPQNLWYNQL